MFPLPQTFHDSGHLGTYLDKRIANYYIQDTIDNFVLAIGSIKCVNLHNPSCIRHAQFVICEEAVSQVAMIILGFEKGSGKFALPLPQTPLT